MGRRFRAIGALTLGGQCWVIHTCLLPQITCLPAAVSYAKPHVLGDRVEALKEPSLIETQSNIRCPDPICRAGSLMFQMGPTDQHAVGVNIEIILLALAVLPRRILECDFDVRAHADSIPPPLAVFVVFVFFVIRLDHLLVCLFKPIKDRYEAWTGCDRRFPGSIPDPLAVVMQVPPRPSTSARAPCRDRSSPQSSRTSRLANPSPADP